MKKLLIVGLVAITAGSASTLAGFYASNTPRALAGSSVEASSDMTGATLATGKIDPDEKSADDVQTAPAASSAFKLPPPPPPPIIDASSVPAEDVIAGSFGANVGGGNYSFPASLSIGNSTFTAGTLLDVSYTDATTNANNLRGVYLHPTFSGATNTSGLHNIFGLNASPISTSVLTNPATTYNLNGVYASPVFSGSTGNNFDTVQLYGVNAEPVFNGVMGGSNDSVIIYGLRSSVNSNLGHGVAGTAVKHGVNAQVTGTADLNVGATIGASGATSNYGIYIGAPGASANNYAIYSESTAQSLFKGSLNVSGGYLQAGYVIAGAPPAADCSSSAHRGRMVLDTTNFRLYICSGGVRGWDYTALND